MDVKQRVIQKFNATLGSDLKGLENIYEFHERLKEEKIEIEKSLSMASTEAPSKVKAVIESVEKIGIEIEQLQVSSGELSENIQEALHENDKNLELQDIVNKIGQLDKTLSYLNFVKCIEDIRH